MRDSTSSLRNLECYAIERDTFQRNRQKIFSPMEIYDNKFINRPICLLLYKYLISNRGKVLSSQAKKERKNCVPFIKKEIKSNLHSQ